MFFFFPITMSKSTLVLVQDWVDWIFELCQRMIGHYLVKNRVAFLLWVGVVVKVNFEFLLMLFVSPRLEIKSSQFPLVVGVDFEGGILLLPLMEHMQMNLGDTMAHSCAIKMIEIGTNNNFFLLLFIVLLVWHRIWSGHRDVIRRRGRFGRWLLKGTIAGWEFGHGGWGSSTKTHLGYYVGFFRNFNFRRLKFVRNIWIKYRSDR